MSFDARRHIGPFFDRHKPFSTLKLDFDLPTAFQERLVPKGGRLAGRTALVHALDVPALVALCSGDYRSCRDYD